MTAPRLGARAGLLVGLSVLLAGCPQNATPIMDDLGGIDAAGIDATGIDLVTPPDAVDAATPDLVVIDAPIDLASPDEEDAAVDLSMPDLTVVEDLSGEDADLAGACAVICAGCCDTNNVCHAASAAT